MTFPTRLACLMLLTGCASEERAGVDPGRNDAVGAPVAAPPAAVDGASPGAPAAVASRPAADAPAAPPQTGTPFVAVNTLQQGMLPEAMTRGRFEIADDCLVLRTEDGLYTPVLPRGARLVRAAVGWRIEFGGKSVGLGEGVNLPGGPTDVRNTRSIRLAAPVPARCPPRLFAIS